MPGNFPLTLYRGDSYRWEFRLWTDAQKTEPADLTGVTAKSEIRDRPGGRIVVALECEVQQPNIVIARLLAEASRDLPLPPAGAWDLQLTYAGGDVRTILAGAVTVTPDVTSSSPQARQLRHPANIWQPPRLLDRATA